MGINGLVLAIVDLSRSTLFRFNRAVPIPKIGHSAHRAAVALRRLRRLRSQKWIFHLLLEILVLVLVLGVRKYSISMFFFRWRPESKVMFGYPSFCLQIRHGQTLAKTASDDQQHAIQRRLYGIAFLAFRCSTVCGTRISQDPITSSSVRGLCTVLKWPRQRLC